MFPGNKFGGEDRGWILKCGIQSGERGIITQRRKEAKAQRCRAASGNHGSFENGGKNFRKMLGNF
jgi:hypothetical protein